MWACAPMPGFVILLFFLIEHFVFVQALSGHWIFILWLMEESDSKEGNK